MPLPVGETTVALSEIALAVLGMPQFPAMVIVRGVLLVRMVVVRVSRIRQGATAK